MEAIDMNKYIKPVLISAAVLLVVTTAIVFAVNIDKIKGSTNNGSSEEPSPTGRIGLKTPNATVSPENTVPATQEPLEKRTITLYFANSNAEKVVAEKREVETEKDTQMERLVFEELQKGPKSENLHATIPQGTKLLSTSTKNGTCTLDLSKEFVDNHPGGSAGELMTLYSIINTMTELPGIDKVQFLIEGQKQEVYIHAIFNEPFKRDDSIIEKNSGETKVKVETRSQIAIKAIKEKDMEKLASMVHPVKGVLFSPYSHIDPEKHKVFTKDQFKGLLESEKVYNWGSYDGSGNPIELTFKQYYDKFIYDHDFANAEKVAYNEIQSYGNTIVNILDVYPEGKFIEYYFPGTKAHDGADWASLRLVFEEYDGEWYLVCIAHGEWTI
ncbi:sporulation protein [Acetivibrio saccincola]|uniref:Sporulation protein n=2 Tax=Acetivibrio saccincola TaxID=1677857 RepID=A0A2S8R9N7_9FIRM|nr:sporulation protein [Acetivibrio saccincola]